MLTPTVSGSRACTRQPPAGSGPASTDPPYCAARSRIPRSPCPPPSSAGSGGRRRGRRARARRPSTATVTTALAGRACLTTLLSASCTIRYAEACTTTGTRARVALAVQLRRAGRASCSRATSSSRSSSRGCGRSSAGCPGARMSPIVSRVSLNAREASSSISRSASAVRAGSRSTSRRPARACRAMPASAWPTTSCRSRAIRTRSWATASRASTSRSASSSRLRSLQRAQHVADDRRQHRDHERREQLQARAGQAVQRHSVETRTTTANVTPAAIAPRRSVRYATEVVANTGPSPLAATA